MALPDQAPAVELVIHGDGGRLLLEFHEARGEVRTRKKVMRAALPRRVRVLTGPGMLHPMTSDRRFLADAIEAFAEASLWLAGGGLDR
jgi:hypothetical protein